MIEQLTYQSVWKAKLQEVLKPEEKEQLAHLEKAGDRESCFQLYCTGLIRMGVCTPENAALYVGRALFPGG